MSKDRTKKVCVKTQMYLVTTSGPRNAVIPTYVDKYFKNIEDALSYFKRCMYDFDCKLSNVIVDEGEMEVPEGF